MALAMKWLPEPPDSEPSSTIHVESYLCPAPGGRTQHRVLEVAPRMCQELPAVLSGLLCTADLQGRELNSARLLGEALAENLAGQIDTSDCGVILAGDFYAAETADKLGASGDVRSVWQSFAEHYRWVAGVAGNHDTFGPPAGQAAFAAGGRIYLLDGDVVDLDGLRLAGLSGIIGKHGRRWRRNPDDYFDQVRKLLAQQPDILILHEAPAGQDLDQRGNAGLAACLKQAVIGLDPSHERVTRCQVFRKNT